MKTNCVLGLLLGSSMAGHLLAADPAGSAPAITVRVVNSAKVSPATLLQGEKQAAYILAKAGVTLTWQDCSAGAAGWQSGVCASNPGATDFWFHVATWKPATSKGEMLGFTTVNRNPADDSVAGVYYPVVKSMAEKFRVEESEVMGPAMAHEIGHLLGVDHSPMGVMCPQFGRSHIVQAGTGGLLFSAPQASQLRTAIIGRMAGGTSDTRTAVAAQLHQ
jgi:hypothetical protein